MNDNQEADAVAAQGNRLREAQAQRAARFQQT